MSATDRSWAPWTDEEVRNLNDFQDSRVYHGFLCHSRHRRCRGQLLEANRSGWTCPKCDYSQQWAYKWMANGQWRGDLGREPSEPKGE